MLRTTLNKTFVSGKIQGYFQDFTLWFDLMDIYQHLHHYGDHDHQHTTSIIMVILIIRMPIIFEIVIIRYQHSSSCNVHLYRDVHVLHDVKSSS